MNYWLLLIIFLSVLIAMGIINVKMTIYTQKNYKTIEIYTKYGIMNTDRISIRCLTAHLRYF